jgi:ubiquitin C-terminal hydrolase
MNKTGTQLKFDEVYKENGATFNLYAIIEHIGRTRKDGHYVAYIKSATGIWHCFDDESVTMTNFERVKKARAYIWIYSKDVKFMEPSST